ncbi:MAG: hypothetical protein AB8I69_02090 [Anaerolineae bacterium]
MNKRRMLILAAALLGGLALATGVLAQGTVSVDWWVVAGGGGASSADEVVVNGTLGQPIIGPSGDKSVALGAGYWYGAQGPTAVTLSAFSAAWSGDDVVVAWETAMEIDTVGFNVWRSETRDGGYVRVNDTLIPSASPGSVWGSAYSYVDSDIIPGTTTYYKLEELEVGGGRNWYGPISTNDDNPNSVILLKATAEGTGFAALAWWLVGTAVVVGAGLVATWRMRKRSAGTG